MADVRETLRKEKQHKSHSRQTTDSKKSNRDAQPVKEQVVQVRNYQLTSRRHRGLILAQCPWA